MKRKRNQPVKEGDKFGRLTIIKEIDAFVNNVRKYRMVLCRCDCGNEIEIRLASLTCGQTKGCGCIRVEFAKSLDATTHGLSYHPLYSVWEGMVQRCHNPNSFGYCYYGGRGIIVCELWRNNFKSFYDWSIINGWEEVLQIDRYPNNNGNYEPNNCRWATSIQNMGNRNITLFVNYNNEKYTLADACRLINVSYNKVLARMRLGNSFEESISTNYINTNKKPLGVRKLSKDDVMDIFNSDKNGVILSKEYNVASSTISGIRTGKIWKNITQLVKRL